MDVTRMLEADHRQVEALFEKIEKAKGDARQPLIDQLATSVRRHVELEEAVLYPQMEPVTGNEAVQEATKEHELARSSLDQMVGLAPEQPGFDAALEATKAGISHHVEEEEGEVFPELRRTGRDVLDRVATPFMKKRMELGLPMDADALAAASSKDELLAEAKGAGVDGAASMSKAELADALAAKMG
jgi:hemerythrin-like domain-containing protein